MLDEAWGGSGDEKSAMGLLDESKGGLIIFAGVL